MVSRISFQQGVILLLVLFYAGIFAVLIQYMTSSVWLNQKIIEDFKNQTITIKKMERLHAQQQEIIDRRHVQFVPDSLHFFEENGTDYYTIITNSDDFNQTLFQSHFAARSNTPTNHHKGNKIRLPNGLEVRVIHHLKSDGGSTLQLKADNLKKSYGRWDFIEPYLNVIAIDAKNRGIADWLYLVSDKTLLRMDLGQLSLPEQTWSPTASIIKASQPLIVGRHPLGGGVLLYLFTQLPDATWQLVAFDDSLIRKFELKIFFSLDIEAPQTQLLLAADWLFFASCDSLYQIDAYTGQLIKYTLPSTLSGKASRALKLILIAPSSNQALIEIEGENSTVAIDLGQRLGRCAWHDTAVLN